MDEAIRWWEQAAAQGHVYAFIELAKFYEHRRRDYPEAQKWAKAALEQIHSGDLPSYVREHWQAELEYRLARLEKKGKKKPVKRKKNL